MKAIRPLVCFAAARAGPLAKMTKIVVTDAKGYDASEGYAYQFAAKPTFLVPALVSIKLGKRDRLYPHYQHFLPETPRVRLGSWEEETLLLIAHELRHIVQFWNIGLCSLSSHESEVDAENFAVMVLRQWRHLKSLEKRREWYKHKKSIFTRS